MNNNYSIEKKASDDSESMQEMLKPSYFIEPTGRRFSFYLSGEITAPEDYVDWFHLIRSASENDMIVININSRGGDMSTALQFMSVLNDTEAKILINLEGECMSAATMIFLCGHMFTISPFSLFMCHNYTSGCIGKGGEMHDRVTYERKWSEGLWTAVYKNFLTPTEIQSLLDGKDIWLNADEIIKRMSTKREIEEKEFEDKLKQLNKAEKKDKPKKKVEKKVTKEVEKEATTKPKKETKKNDQV